MHKLFLTFDTEDFISKNSIPGLHRVLEILKKHEQHAVFFITGHMAEKLAGFPETTELLKEHQIGYHSSSHSVHPTIFEFTDVADYREAFQISLQRETAHVNPLTGEIEGKGGIYALQDLFPEKEIVAFRAPGHCWSPPHLEALKSLGISYDFSANVCDASTSYKEIVFFPYPLIGHWHGRLHEYRNLYFSLRHSISVLTIHPSLMVNKSEWDSIFCGSNPTKLSQPLTLTGEDCESQFQEFDLLLKRLKTLRRMNVLEITPELEKTQKGLPRGFDVEACYQKSVRWANRHNYEPKYLRQHFKTFFSK